jgi:hypothetical protein
MLAPKEMHGCLTANGEAFVLRVCDAAAHKVAAVTK